MHPPTDILRATHPTHIDLSIRCASQSLSLLFSRLSSTRHLLVRDFAIPAPISDIRAHWSPVLRAVETVDIEEVVPVPDGGVRWVHD